MIDRDTASRLGLNAATIDNTLYDAFGQRQVSTFYTQLNRIPRGDGSRAGIPAAARTRSRTSTCARRTACRCRSARSPTSSRRIRAGRKPPGAVSCGHAFFQSCPGRRRSATPSTRSRSVADAASACRPPFAPVSRARRRPSRPRWRTSPSLILAALVAVYIVLGMLYESYIHPITILSTLPSAGVGALLALLLMHDGSQRDRADRHHPADRHREEERDHDDRFRPGRRAQGGEVARRKPSIRPACCASAPS